MELDTALAIAVNAHSNQLDKAGEPYILHPIRLMQSFDSMDLKIIAVLHDVVEDSRYTIDHLKNAGLSEEVIIAIECLTKRSNEDYFLFINRVKSNTLATKVKIADIIDNLNLARLKRPLSIKDLDRVKKYHSALAILLESNHHLI